MDCTDTKKPIACYIIQNTKPLQMGNKKNSRSIEKSKLHPRNKHRGRYNFKELINSCPALATFVKSTKYQEESIDFYDPIAVKMLNTALLKHFYKIKNWDLPNGYLCPPIPGRADYIHHIADLLVSHQPEILKGRIPTGSEIKCLDIGVGSSCIYPIIGNKEYGWSFIGSDIDPVALQSSNKIIENNPPLKEHVELRLQTYQKDFFNGIIQKDDVIDFSICNPPFHASQAEAQTGTLRKLSNLKQKKVNKPILNFGGQKLELWYEGGEEMFVRKMIGQSREYSTSCFWFTTLISKKSNLKSVYSALKKVAAVDVKTIPMGQGNKTSRIVAWTFLTQKQQRIWIHTRWKR
jgi:23S rRNA (adenine1618-N6)-methyltransferase